MEASTLRIGVLGTGVVGRAHAAGLVEKGHEVMIGTRDTADTLARSEPDFMGNEPFPVWQKRNPGVQLGSFADAGSFGQMVINATLGSAALEALTLAGAANLAGKILVDISNPLDFSAGLPPSLFVCSTDSLGEQITTRLPADTGGEGAEHGHRPLAGEPESARCGGAPCLSQWQRLAGQGRSRPAPP